VLPAPSFAQMRAQSPQGGRIAVDEWLHLGPFAATRSDALHGHQARNDSPASQNPCRSTSGRPFGVACGQIDFGNALTEMAAPMTRKGVPQANGTMAPEPTMNVDDVAKAVLMMAQLPLASNVRVHDRHGDETRPSIVGRGSGEHHG